MRELKLIIADDEPYICKLLEKLVDFQANGLKLVCCVNDGESLAKQIEEISPDIVLTDISMPKKDGLEVIKETKEKGILCHFIVISGYRQFEYAHTALKYDVDDYLLKPIEREELNRVLAKICGEIRTNHMDEQAENRELHKVLFDKGVSGELRDAAVSYSDINRNYKTALQKGVFRIALLKLDFDVGSREQLMYVPPVLRKMEELCRRFLSNICYDVVTTQKPDGVMFIMNYDNVRENDLRKQLHNLYTEARMFIGFDVTLCIGKAVRETSRFEETQTSCRRASWMRMHLGVNREIYAEEVEDISDAAALKVLEEAEAELGKAYTVMDEEAAKEAIARIFNLPVKILCSTACMMTVRSSIHKLCECYSVVLKDVASAEAAWEDIAVSLKMAKTFEEYKTSMTKYVAVYLGKMRDSVRGRNLKPIRIAKSYVEKHYTENFSLEDIADIVNLNPVYFSNLFKKETGQNFKEYVTAFKISKAKELLKRGEQNVNEIAEILGYADPKYFSKVFKKEVGVKPTDYRKIYG